MKAQANLTFKHVRLSPYNARPLRLKYSVLPPLRIGGVQQVMTLLTKRLDEEILIEGEYLTVLVGLPDRVVPVLLIDRLGSLLAYRLVGGNGLASPT